MIIKLSVQTLIVLGCALIFLVGCENSDQMDSNMMELDAAQSIDSQTMSNDQLTHQLPLELTLTADQRNEYLEVLNGIYEELNTTQSHIQEAPDGSADPNANCDRCGRETGFLPIPDLFLTGLIPVEMKALTLGIASWEIDLNESIMGLAELLGDEAPEMPIFSYRLILAQVDIESMSSEERAQATMGTLFENGGSENISLTSLSTTQSEAAISFDHGFAYVLSLIATEGNTKLSSEPSAPLMIYCPNHNKDDQSDDLLNAGCIQLVDDREIN